MLKSIVLILPLFTGLPAIDEPEQRSSALPETATIAGDRQKTIGSATIQQDLTYEMVAGTWIGTVDEIETDPYTITLTFDDLGLGQVTYSGYDCAGLLAPVSTGTELRFRETITAGRDVCADGDIHITLDGAEMIWIWINEYKEIQARARLSRRNP